MQLVALARMEAEVLEPWRAAAKEMKRLQKVAPVWMGLRAGAVAQWLKELGQVVGKRGAAHGCNRKQFQTG